jgi:hypothetical protein
MISTKKRRKMKMVQSKLQKIEILKKERTTNMGFSFQRGVC